MSINITFKTKIFIGFFVVATMIMVVAYFSIVESRKIIIDSIGKNSVLLAQETIDKIDRAIYNRIEEIDVYSRSYYLQQAIIDSNLEFETLDDIEAYIKEQDDLWIATDRDEITPLLEDKMNKGLEYDLNDRLGFYNLKHGYPIFGEIFVTNKYGVIITQTRKASDYYQADEIWWQQAKQNSFYVEDVHYDESANIYSIAIGLRVDDKAGNFLGVIKAVYDLKTIIEIIEEIKTELPNNLEPSHDNPAVVTPSMHFKLLTSDGQIIYQPREYYDYEFLEPLENDLVIFLEASHDFSYFISKDIEPEEGEVLFAHAHSNGYRDYKGFDWIFIIEHKTEDIFKPINELRSKLLGVSLLVILLSAFLALLINRLIPKMALESDRLSNLTKDTLRVVNPILHKVSKGDFSQKIKINGKKDEFSSLLAGINIMIDNLKLITENLKNSEKKIKDSEERYRAIYESSHDAIMTLAPPTWKFTAGNPGTIKMFGVKNEKDFTARAPWQYSPLVQPDGQLSSVKAKKMIDQAMEKGYNFFEWTHKDLSGKEFYASVLLVKIKLKNQEFLQATVRDITDLKLSTEQIKAERDKALIERDKVNAIIRNIGDGVFVIDGNYNIVLINRVACELAQCDIKEAIGQPYFKILKFVDEKTKKVNDEFIKRTMERGEVVSISNRSVIVRPDGSAIAIADSSAPLKDSFGKVIGCVVIFRDVTKERQIDRMKTEFVSVASHQLRTPLTGIKWFLELLLNQKVGDLNKKQIEFLNQVTQSNERMISLVSDLLSVSRIETGGDKFEINKRNINIVPVIDSVLADNIVLIKERKIKIISCTSKHDKIMAWVDPEYIRQVFNNIISNAIKYSNNSGKVEIGCKSKNGDIIFFVKDSGVGIPVNQQKRIFEKFFRADNIITKETSGTGLGLYIAKAIVEGHGGKIWFESQEGQGTTFYFSIPKKH